MASFDEAPREGQEKRPAAITVEARKTRREEADFHYERTSLHGDGLGEISRLVDVGTLVVRYAVRVEL